MGKRSRLIFASLVLVISLWTVGFFLLGEKGHQTRYLANDIFAKVDTYITDEMRSQSIPGLALGIVKDGHIVHLKGYGQADASGRLVTAETPFIIGSNSKSFTAIAIL